MSFPENTEGAAVATADPLKVESCNNASDYITSQDTRYSRMVPIREPVRAVIEAAMRRKQEAATNTAAPPAAKFVNEDGAHYRVADPKRTSRFARGMARDAHRRPWDKPPEQRTPAQHRAAVAAALTLEVSDPFASLALVAAGSIAMTEGGMK